MRPVATINGTRTWKSVRKCRSCKDRYQPLTYHHMAIQVSAKCRLMPDVLPLNDAPLPGVFFNLLLSTEAFPGKPTAATLYLKSASAVTVWHNGTKLQLDDKPVTVVSNAFGMVLLSIDAIETPAPPAIYVRTDGMPKDFWLETWPLWALLQPLSKCDPKQLESLLEMESTSDFPLPVPAAIAALAGKGKALLVASLGKNEHGPANPPEGWDPATGHLALSPHKPPKPGPPADPLALINILVQGNSTQPPQPMAELLPQLIASPQQAASTLLALLEWAGHPAKKLVDLLRFNPVVEDVLNTKAIIHHQFENVFTEAMRCSLADGPGLQGIFDQLLGMLKPPPGQKPRFPPDLPESSLKWLKKWQQDFKPAALPDPRPFEAGWVLCRMGEVLTQDIPDPEKLLTDLLKDLGLADVALEFFAFLNLVQEKTTGQLEQKLEELQRALIAFVQEGKTPMDLAKWMTDPDRLTDLVQQIRTELGDADEIMQALDHLLHTILRTIYDLLTRPLTLPRLEQFIHAIWLPGLPAGQAPPSWSIFDILELVLAVPAAIGLRAVTKTGVSREDTEAILNFRFDLKKLNISKIRKEVTKRQLIPESNPAPVNFGNVFAAPNPQLNFGNVFAAPKPLFDTRFSLAPYGPSGGPSLNPCDGDFVRGPIALMTNPTGTPDELKLTENSVNIVIVTTFFVELGLKGLFEFKSIIRAFKIQRFQKKKTIIDKETQSQQIRTVIETFCDTLINGLLNGNAMVASLFELIKLEVMDDGWKNYPPVRCHEGKVYAINPNILHLIRTPRYLLMDLLVLAQQAALIFDIVARQVNKLGKIAESVYLITIITGEEELAAGDEIIEEVTEMEKKVGPWVIKVLERLNVVVTIGNGIMEFVEAPILLYDECAYYDSPETRPTPENATFPPTEDSLAFPSFLLNFGEGMLASIGGLLAIGEAIEQITKDVRAIQEGRKLAMVWPDPDEVVEPDLDAVVGLQDLDGSEALGSIGELMETGVGGEESSDAGIDNDSDIKAPWEERLSKPFRKAALAAHIAETATYGGKVVIFIYLLQKNGKPSTWTN